MTALVELARAAEARLVDALNLAPEALPAALARASGRFKGLPVSLTARAWRGGTIAYARVVQIEGEGLEIANLLAIPLPASPLPILGADLVRMGDGSALAVADVSPIVAPGPERDAQLAAIRRHVPAARLPSAGDPPLWARRLFSPHALFARVAAGQEPALHAPMLGFVESLVDLAAEAARAPATAGDHGAAQARYLSAHREEDRFLNLLRRVFDPRLADRLVAEVLFPRGWPR